ncbi:hypothetical protein [Pseudomonas synxantha]|uniref:hypothetical protein n=1 Tax=Pseudomonas synxantha TaxID=47883 RepID=UPI000A577393|nr:hypothetical protein [Pseudomonas synxantha]
MELISASLGSKPRYDLSGRSYLVFLLIGITFSPSGVVNAEEKMISKTVTPTVINVISIGGTGLAIFSLSPSDFPAGSFGVPKQLLGIDWNTTSYPENIKESVELCYSRPYNTAQRTCVPIWPGSSGTSTDFNDQPFGQGAGVTIKHHVLGGGARLGYPAGSDTVTVRYRD